MIHMPPVGENTTAMTLPGLKIQIIPFPSKSILQVHVKLPIVLVQVAFSSHLLRSALHSSISAGNCTIVVDWVRIHSVLLFKH